MKSTGFSFRGDQGVIIDGPFSTQDLLCAPIPPAFDAITRTVRRLLSVPVALVSIVEEHKDRQVFASQLGVCEPWAAKGETPLSHSFCQHVKACNRPLVVRDAREDDLLKDNLAIPDLGVIAYMGVPIHAPDGQPLGALCAICDGPRDWTPQELDQLTDLAVCVSDEITLRAATQSLSDTHRRLERLHKSARRQALLKDSIAQVMMAPDLPIEARFQELLGAACRALRFQQGTIAAMGGGVPELMFVHPHVPALRNMVLDDGLPRLADRVTRGQSQLVLPDIAPDDPDDPITLMGGTPACYAGAPLILNGFLFGVIEFHSDQPMLHWGDAEDELLCTVVMFASAWLGAYQKVLTLKRTSPLMSEAYHAPPTRRRVQGHS